ncbi:HNH endonuclease signature motif containing protein [Morganella morganii]|uniref:HNH endonuclease signature motif containing protein n=1 Tax=Morganella morganii TaxID=582 RepID=UPI000DDBF54E|nr:HNH endonuclease signature motif containing protein [Morganella morganii]
MKFSNKYVKSNFKNIGYDNTNGCLFNTETGDSYTAWIDHRGYKRLNLPVVGTVIEHRAIWAVVHGRCPDMHIDHIDNDKLNNRIEKPSCMPRTTRTNITKGYGQATKADTKVSAG